MRVLEGLRLRSPAAAISDLTAGAGSTWYELCEPITWIWFHRASSPVFSRAADMTLWHRIMKKRIRSGRPPINAPDEEHSWQ